MNKPTKQQLTDIAALAALLCGAYTEGPHRLLNGPAEACEVPYMGHSAKKIKERWLLLREMLQEIGVDVPSQP